MTKLSQKEIDKLMRLNYKLLKDDTVDKLLNMVNLLYPFVLKISELEILNRNGSKPTKLALEAQEILRKYHEK